MGVLALYRRRTEMNRVAAVLKRVGGMRVLPITYPVTVMSSRRRIVSCFSNHKGRPHFHSAQCGSDTL